MTTYSNWFAGQLVEETDMLNATDDIYQRLAQMYADRPIPYIVTGLTPTINGSGLVTVAAGVGIDNPFNQSDYPALPADGLASIGQLVGSGTSQVTAVADEYGLVVLRQTITPETEGETLYTIVSTLVYLPGTSTTYPTPGGHDIVIIGVITSGTSPSQTYLLDYNPRSLDQESYAATIRQTPYLNNVHFDTWQYGTGPFTIEEADGGVQTANNWFVSTQVVATGVEASRYELTPLESALIPNTPTYGLQIERAVAATGDPDNLYQTMTTYQALNGKYLIYSTWAKLTAADDMTVSFFLDYSNLNDSDEVTVIAQTESTFTVPADDTFHLYTFAVWIPNLLTTPGSGSLNEIAVNWYITNDENETYTMVVTESYLQSGKYYLTPSLEADAPLTNTFNAGPGAANTGYFEIPGNPYNFIVNYGQVEFQVGVGPSFLTEVTTFAKPFPNASLSIQWTPVVDGATFTVSNHDMSSGQPSTTTLTQATCDRTAPSGNDVVSYICIGY